VLLGSAVWCALASIAVLAARPLIVRAYGGDVRADVGRAALEVLVVVAAFQLFDSLQVVSAGALRGARDTRSALIWSAVAYGVVAPAVVAATVAAGFGLTGIWTGLAAGLAVAAAALARRALAIRGS
jgi:MATE family multidrug resistance protein